MINTKIIDDWKNYIENNLIPIIKSCGGGIEGNLYSKSNNLSASDLLDQKQKNFVKAITDNQEKKRILEIGFNAGYSALLMLMCNPDIDLLCVDINMHKYTKPCYEKIKSDFNNITFIAEASRSALPKLIDSQEMYDIIHIDGGHDKITADTDIDNSLKLCKSGSLLIVDDTHMSHINQTCNRLLSNNIVKEYLKPDTTVRYQHRILQKI